MRPDTQPRDVLGAQRSEGLKRQRDYLLTALSPVLTRAERPLRSREMLFVDDYVGRYITTRNARADEAASPEVQNAVQIAEKLYSRPPFQVLCIDGRVLPILVGGFVAGIAGALRTPAADLSEVVRDTDGQPFLQPGSVAARLIDEAVHKHEGGISQILDSHCHCAARGAHESNLGAVPQDAGLYKDVVRKSQIAVAMRRYAQEQHGNPALITPIQFSFNPGNGYGYMGLEREDVLRAYSSTQSFPHDLGELARQGTIISTELLAQDSTIAPILAEYAFPIDWTHTYSHSAQLFWTGIQSIASRALPTVLEKVSALYPGISPQEANDRSLLLISNMYSGFLHRQYESGWPYSVHKESGVNVTIGAHGPFEDPMFAVLSADHANLAARVAFAQGIVRGNRRNGVIASNYFSDGAEFAQATVPLVVTDTVRGTFDLSHISRIDFSDMPKEWYTMTDDAFDAYMFQKDPDISARELFAVQDLRHKVQKLYEPGSPTSSLLIDGDLTIMPMIVDANRRIAAIVPFVLTGFPAHYPATNSPSSLR